MEVFTISYYILLIVLLVFSVIFFFVPIPKVESIKNYKISLRLFSISYIFLALYCYLKLSQEPQLLGIPFLIAASFQAIVLGLSHVNLVNSTKITPKYVLNHFMPWFGFILLWIIDIVFSAHYQLDSYQKLLFWKADNAWHMYDIILREVWFIAYFISVIYFGYRYFREERRYKMKAENFTSDYDIVNIPIVHHSFLLALAIACTTVLITGSLSWLVCTILNYVILIFYIGMGVLYIQYPKRYFEVSAIMLNELQHAIQQKDTKNEAKQELTWNTIRNQIIEKKLYQQKGVTIEDIAQEIGVNRTCISNMVNTYENVNFNSFINSLRIAEAQILLQENKLTIAEISDQIGYTEQGNFSRQFKQIVGCSPSAYRKENENLHFTPPVLCNILRFNN